MVALDREAVNELRSLTWFLARRSGPGEDAVTREAGRARARLDGPMGGGEPRRWGGVGKVGVVTKRAARAGIRASTGAPAATQSRANSTTL